MRCETTLTPKSGSSFLTKDNIMFLAVAGVPSMGRCSLKGVSYDMNTVSTAVT